MWLTGIECLEYSGDDVSIRRVPCGLELPMCEMRKHPGGIMRGEGERIQVSKGGNGEGGNLWPTYHTNLPY